MLLSPSDIFCVSACSLALDYVPGVLINQPSEWLVLCHRFMGIEYVVEFFERHLQSISPDLMMYWG